MEIVLTSFVVPAVDKSMDARPMGKFAATGSLRLKGPIVVEVPGEKPQKVNVDGAVVNIDSPGLAQYVNVDGSAIVEGAGITIKQKITNLFDQSGALFVSPFSCS